MKRPPILLILLLAGCGGEGDPGTHQAGSAPLPRVPAEGLIVSKGPAEIQFLDVEGRAVGRLRGYRLQSTTGTGLTVVRAGKRYRLDLTARRLRPIPVSVMRGVARQARRTCQPGPERNGVRYVLCRRDHGRVIEATVVRIDSAGERTTITANPPRTRSASDGGRIGHWRSAFLSPDGSTLLLQWSGECEVPIAFVVRARGGQLRVVSGERDWAKGATSEALGFSRNGRAIVFFPLGACGSSAGKPGVYAIEPTTLRRELIATVPKHSVVLMWGPYAPAPAP